MQHSFFKLRTPATPGLFQRLTLLLVLLLLAGPAAWAQAPTITGFSPASGLVGSSITVQGTNLLGTTSASLNGVAGVLEGTPTATSVTFRFGSDAGSGPVSVTTPGGSASSSGSFTVLAPGGPCATATLATPYASNNSGKGEMFNIVALNTITISCFDLSLALGSRGAYEVYYKPGSYVGSENTAADWTLLGSNADVPSLGLDYPSPLGIPLAITIPAGQTAAFYVTATSLTAATRVAYTSNAGYTAIANNADLRIEGGIGKGYPFMATFTNRSFNGTVHYTVGPPPVITSFSPGGGPVGSTVTVTGSNLAGTTAVQVNGRAGTIVGTPTATGLTFTVSAGTSTGPITIGATGGWTTSASSFVVGSAPVLTSSAGATTWTQGGGPVAVDAALTLTDASSFSQTGATVRLTTGFQAGQDVLAFTAANGITGSYAAGTGVLTLSGTATVARYQAALRSVTYDNTAGTPNAANRTVSFEATDGFFTSPAATKTVSISIPTPTPALTAPADGSSTNDTTPSYTGTAAGSSTVTVYVDGSSIGTTTTSSGGNWSKTQATALAPGSHTVYATAQAGSLPVSAASATRTFTVDTTAPTVVITSPAGASGGSTATTPVPFTLTFSEPVTGLLITEVTVSGGTKSALTTVSSSEYTLSVTPTTVGSTITVNIAAGRAQDAATNGNTVATTFTITYVLAPTITALSAAAELPGRPLTLTGTGFTAASTVSIGGVAASVTYNSATSLTATVPAGAAPGSAAVVVSTSGVSSTSAPAFAVLGVYDGTASCLSTTPYAATGDGQWHYLRTPAGEVVAALQDTRAALGNVTVSFQATGSAGAVRQDARSRTYLDRNFRLSASGGNAFPGQTINVRFYGLVSEFNRLVAADAGLSYATLKATQYSGPNEDCELANNSATAEHRTLALAASTPGGVPWFVAQAAVADHFSEFYLTGSSTPLPVELLAFTAEAKAQAVQLSWRTASEKSSARFEVERSIDGKPFELLGEVKAQGNTARPSSYSFRDPHSLLPSYPQALYYRLRQVDLDGAASYSPVRAVTIGGKRELSLYPSPAHATVAVAGLPAGATVDVLDALGRPVATATADASGAARLVLPSGLAAGMYMVRSGRQLQRLAVQ